jgi:hypothetical protein
VNDIVVVRSDEVGEAWGWQRRREAVLMVCGRCRPDEDRSWVRAVRHRLYGVFGSKALTVTVSGCVGTCPEGRIAVVLANAGGGCWDLAIAPECPHDHTVRLAAELASSVGRLAGMDASRSSRCADEEC